MAKGIALLRRLPSQHGRSSSLLMGLKSYAAGFHCRFAPPAGEPLAEFIIVARQTQDHGACPVSVILPTPATDLWLLVFLRRQLVRQLRPHVLDQLAH